MADRFLILEQRISALLSRIEEHKSSLESLKYEKEEYIEKVKEAEGIRKENRQLQAKVNLLEKNLKNAGGSPASLKSKVKSVIKRIESLEKEIAQL